MLGLLTGAVLTRARVAGELPARPRSGCSPSATCCASGWPTSRPPPRRTASWPRPWPRSPAPWAGSRRRCRSLERDRVDQYARLGEQIESVRLSGEALRTQTASLAGALRSPTARGAWGEVQLRRVVEHAGMLDRVDFSTQVTLTTPDGAVVRPDLVVHLPGRKHIVVDAKAPLAAFLQASEASDGRRACRPQAAIAHARALRGHVDALAAKEYWRAVESSPEAGRLLRAGRGVPGRRLHGRPRPCSSTR